MMTSSEKRGGDLAHVIPATDHLAGRQGLVGRKELGASLSNH
jgi:hypothetical protein